jgi:HSP20 family protein
MTYRVSFMAPDLAATLQRAHRELDRTVATLFPPAAPSAVRSEAPASPAAEAVRWQPATDLVEEATGWTLTLDLPGVAADALEVVAEARSLVVRGARADLTIGESARAVQRERRTGAFERRFRLPASADAEQLSARLQDGVLTLRIGKVAPARPRRIRIDQPADAPPAPGGAVAPDAAAP